MNGSATMFSIVTTISFLLAAVSGVIWIIAAIRHHKTAAKKVCLTGAFLMVVSFSLFLWSYDSTLSPPPPESSTSQDTEQPPAASQETVDGSQEEDKDDTSSTPPKAVQTLANEPEETPPAEPAQTLPDKSTEVVPQKPTDELQEDPTADELQKEDTPAEKPANKPPKEATPTPQKPTDEPPKEDTPAPQKPQPQRKDESAAQTSVNPMLSLEIQEHPVMNGFQTERIGTWASVTVTKEFMSSVTDEQMYQYLEGLSEKEYNWFNVFFEDGTGLWTISPAFIDYGEVDPDEGGSVEYVGEPEDCIYTFTDGQYITGK